jgi:hypothetical protein
MHPTPVNQSTRQRLSRAVAGVLALGGFAAWCALVINMIVEARTPSWGTAASVLLSMPLGIYMFARYAITGKSL